MPRPAEISSDVREVQVLRRALRAVSSADLSKNRPTITWRVSLDDKTNNAVLRAATKAILDALPPAQFKPAVAAVLQDRLDAILGKYPGLNIEE